MAHILVNKLNKKWILLVIPLIVGALWYSQQERPLGVKLENPQIVDWVKPTTDAGWAEDVKKESLDFKYDYQLDQMEENLTMKLPKHQVDLDKITLCPDCIKWDLRQDFERMFEGEDNPSRIEGKTLQEWIDGEFAEQVINTTWEVEKVTQSIERIQKEKNLRASGFLTIIDRIPADNPARKNIKANERSPLGTIFFIDADCATPGNGSTATCVNDGNDSFDELDENTKELLQLEE